MRGPGPSPELESSEGPEELRFFSSSIVESLQELESKKETQTESRALSPAMFSRQRGPG